MRAARVLSSLAVAALLLFARGAVAASLAQATASPAGPADGTSVLTNADVVRMLKSGFSDSAVIAVIQKARTRFDLSSASLAELRYAGVSDAVIVAMLESGERTAGPPATPTPAAPAPERVVAPQPAPRPGPEADEKAPVEKAPVESEEGAEQEASRGGGVFGLALGGNYAFFVDQGFSDDEPRFGGSLGLQVGGHVGRSAVILADIHASLWPETDTYETAALFSVGPAVRFSPVPHLSFEGGISFAVAVPSFHDDPGWDDSPWLGPAGHLRLGIELTNGRSRFALELAGRFDLAYLNQYDCEGCDAVTLGRATTQLAFTWY